MKKRIIVTCCCTFLLLFSQNALADCAKGKQLYENAMSQKDDSEKIRLLKASLAECKNFNAYYELAKAYESNEEFKNATDALEQAKNIAKTNKAIAKVLSRLGLISEKTGEEGKAYVWFQQAYENHPYPKIRKKIKEIEVRRMEKGMSAEQIRDTLLASRGFTVQPSVNLHINFEYDKAILDSDGMSQADELGRALADSAFANNSFTLIGHTDSQGEEPYNQSLSERRAESVKAYMLRHFSLKPGRIHTQGEGERKLLYDPEKTEQDCKLNRRVEVRVD